MPDVDAVEGNIRKQCKYLHVSAKPPAGESQRYAVFSVTILSYLHLLFFRKHDFQFAGVNDIFPRYSMVVHRCCSDCGHIRPGPHETIEAALDPCCGCGMDRVGRLDRDVARSAGRTCRGGLFTGLGSYPLPLDAASVWGKDDGEKTLRLKHNPVVKNRKYILDS